MNKHGVTFLTFCLLFFVFSAFGQDENKSIELKRILENIARQHHIKFNYLEEDVAGHSIFPPEPSLPLKAKLVYVSNRTLLNFRQVANSIIIYSGNSKETRPKCAFVTDDTGQPLEKSVVQYAGIRIVTGNDGYFEFPEVITELYIEHAGYSTRHYKIQETYGDCAHIQMNLEAQQLQEIVTERYLATGITQTKNGGYHIKPARFGILPGLTEADVLQAMQQLPGINSADETVSNINVRGGTHDQNLFMWNGIRLFQTSHFFGLISALNPNLAHEVKISKNGTSAFYGESTSGTVDITSHAQAITTTHGSIGANMISTDAHTAIQIDSTSDFELTARRSFTDAFNFPTYNEYSKRIFQNTVVTAINSNNDVFYRSDKEFYFYDFTGQYHKTINKKHHIYLNGIGIKNKLDFTQSTFLPNGFVLRKSDLDQVTFGGSALWRAAWNDRHSSEANFYASYYNVDALNSDIESSNLTLQQNIIRDLGFRLSHAYVLTPAIQLTAGYQFNRTGIKNRDLSSQPPETRIEKHALHTHAAAIQAEYNNPESNYYLQAGLRTNYIAQLDMLYTEPRLSFTYRLNQDIKLNIQAEQKSQSTNQITELQNDFLGIEKRRWILANGNDIPVQRSNQAAIGFTYKRNGWLISLDNFYKKVKGITSGAQAFQNQFETITDKGYYEVYGAEFLVQKQLKYFYIWLSYTYNNNTYHFNNLIPSSFTNNFELPHIVNNAITYEWKNIKIGVGSRLTSGRPYTAPLIYVPVDDNYATAIIYDYPNGRRLKSYFEINFSAGYKIALSDKIAMQAGVSVLNLLNRKNIINRYYRLNTTADDIEVVNTYGLQRTPNVMVRFQF